MARGTSDPTLQGNPDGGGQVGDDRNFIGTLYDTEELTVRQVCGLAGADDDSRCRAGKAPEEIWSVLAWIIGRPHRAQPSIVRRTSRCSSTPCKEVIDERYEGQNQKQVD